MEFTIFFSFPPFYDKNHCAVEIVYKNEKKKNILKILHRRQTWFRNSKGNFQIFSVAKLLKSDHKKILH